MPHASGGRVRGPTVVSDRLAAYGAAVREAIETTDSLGDTAPT